MRHRLLPISLLALAFFFGDSFLAKDLSTSPLPGLVFAKDKKPAPYALIFGTVYGPDDRPRQGVVVKIRRALDKKAKWEHLSDSHGEFAQRVPPGTAEYIVWAELKNRQAAQKTEVKV